MYPLKVVNPSGLNVHRGLLRMPVVRQGVRTGQVTRQGVNDDGDENFTPRTPREEAVGVGFFFITATRVP
jgi:hypothetical protein